MKIKEINYQTLPFLKYLASYNVFNQQSDAVTKNNNGYRIRITKSLGYQRQEWVYFELDETGLILKSPRGWGCANGFTVRPL